MRTLFFTLAATALMLMLVSSPALAQRADYTQRKYDKLVHQAIGARDNKAYLFVQLRQAYSQIDDYDPDGIKVIEEMNALAPQIQPKSEDLQDIKNFDRFKWLMLTHLANLAIAENAAKLAETYPDILNKGQMTYIVNGLKASLTLSGNGQSQRTAYDLYTLSEEAALLQQLGLIPQYKAQQEQGPLTFAIYKTTDKNTQEPRTVYANISTAAKKLKESPKKEKKKSPLLPED